MKQTIRGAVPSKSNSYRVVTIGGHGSLAKQPALKDYEKSFYLQCSGGIRGNPVRGLFSLSVDVYYKNNRPDLDNCLKTVLDCLQQCGAIKNDRDCVEIVARKFIDAENPRIELEITPISAGQ